MYGYFGKALMSLKSFDFIYVYFLYTIVYTRSFSNRLFQSGAKQRGSEKANSA